MFSWLEGSANPQEAEAAQPASSSLSSMFEGASSRRRNDGQMEDEDLQMLHEMFSNLDTEVLRTIWHESNGSLTETIDLACTVCPLVAVPTQRAPPKRKHRIG